MLLSDFALKIDEEKKTRIENLKHTNAINKETHMIDLVIYY